MSICYVSYTRFANNLTVVQVFRSLQINLTAKWHKDPLECRHQITISGCHIHSCHKSQNNHCLYFLWTDRPDELSCIEKLADMLTQPRFLPITCQHITHHNRQKQKSIFDETLRNSMLEPMFSIICTLCLYHYGSGNLSYIPLINDPMYGAFMFAFWLARPSSILSGIWDVVTLTWRQRKGPLMKPYVYTTVFYRWAVRPVVTWLNGVKRYYWRT